MRLLQAFWGHKPHQGLSETIGRAVRVTERPVTSHVGATRPPSRVPPPPASPTAKPANGQKDAPVFVSVGDSAAATVAVVVPVGDLSAPAGATITLGAAVISGGRWVRGQSRAHRRDRLVSRGSSSSDTRRAFRWLGGVNEVVGAIAVEGRLFGGCGVVLWAGLRDAVSGTQSFCFTSG